MFILADIGGTKTRIAGSADLESFGEPIIFPTPQKYEEGVASIAEHVGDIVARAPIEAIAVGVPAMLSRDRRSIVSDALHIPDWHGKSLASDIERALSAKVVLENDTALVGLGEALRGAGKGASIVMYMTVSTGVNGARIIDGVIDRTAFGFATGRQYVSMGDEPTSWSDLISGSAISKKFGVLSPRELGKDHPLWEELARIAAFGVCNGIVHWSPDRVVLGGSMFNEIGIAVERVEFHLQILLKDFLLPELVHSDLGDLGGLWGGLALLKQLHP